MATTSALKHARDAGYFLIPTEGETVVARGLFLEVGRDAPDRLVRELVDALANPRPSKLCDRAAF